jgi:rhodanese-related sulfurtransferase
MTAARRALKDSLYDQVARIASATSSPKRLELIELLCQAPKTVDLLAQEAGISVKLASAHLKVLRAARLVQNERNGRPITYRLASDLVASFWVTVRSLAEDRSLELQDLLRSFSGDAPEWVSSDGGELLRKAERGEVLVIDVRPGIEYQAGHLSFARSLPLSELQARLAELPKDKPIIAYCRGPFCLMATDAAQMLRAKGLDASHLRDGIAEWSAKTAMAHAAKHKD